MQHDHFFCIGDLSVSDQHDKIDPVPNFGEAEILRSIVDIQRIMPDHRAVNIPDK